MLIETQPQKATETHPASPWEGLPRGAFDSHTPPSSPGSGPSLGAGAWEPLRWSQSWPEQGLPPTPHRAKAAPNLPLACDSET